MYRPNPIATKITTGNVASISKVRVTEKYIRARMPPMTMMIWRNNSANVTVNTSCTAVMSLDTRLLRSPTRRVS